MDSVETYARQDKQLTNDREALVDAEIAAYRLLQKHHQETDCGRGDVGHSAECDGLVDAFGWVSWEAWEVLVMNAG